MKASLKKDLGKTSLTRVEFETSLHEVESLVNSHPLTFVGDEVQVMNLSCQIISLLGRSLIFVILWLRM